MFDTEFGKIGLCICYDFRFPELSRLMVDKGAKAIIVPASYLKWFNNIINVTCKLYQVTWL